MAILFALAHLVVAALLAYATNWLGLISWRKSAGAHWTERARRLWPVRVTAMLSVFALPALLYQARLLLFPEISSEWMLNGFLAFVGALLGCYPIDREINPSLNFTLWRHQVVALWGFRFGVWVLLIAGLLLMPPELGPRMVIVTAGYLLLHLAIVWGFLMKYLRLVKFARRTDARLQRIVDEASAAMGITPRATWQLGGSQALAAALPTTNELLFSDRLLEICTDEEISVICSHELAHLTESKTVLAGRLVGSTATFPLIFLIPSTHYIGWYGPFVLYGGLLALMWYARWLSQRMEKRADQIAVGKQTNDGVYAGALEKLYRENQIPAVNVNNRQTHPHLYDRMLAAGITPDYPRPARPRRFTWLTWLFFVAYVVMLYCQITRR